MAKTWALFLQDVKLSLYGLYFYVEIITAVVFVAAMLLLVPENFERRQRTIVHIELAEPARSAISEELKGLGAHLTIVPTREELATSMSRDRTAGGLAIYQAAGQLTYEIILQGHESERTQRMIRAIFEGSLMARLPGFESPVSTTLLQAPAPRLSDRDNILPIYLTMNVAMMGMFIIASYIFLDKEEGVIKALAVTPLSVGQYLASKMLLLLGMGMVSSLVVVAILRPQVNYLLLMGLVASFNLFGSALGLLIASYFNSMVQAMEMLYSAMLVLMLGTIAYLLPSFSPWWMRVLPSYTMLFAFRELILPGGDTGMILVSILQFAIIGALLFLYARFRYQRSLTV